MLNSLRAFILDPADSECPLSSGLPYLRSVGHPIFFRGVMTGDRPCSRYSLQTIALLSPGWSGPRMSAPRADWHPPPPAGCSRWSHAACGCFRESHSRRLPWGLPEVRSG